MLAAAGQAGAEADDALHEILEEIDGRTDGDGRYARYLAELALAARASPSEEGLRPAREALAAFGREEAAGVAYFTAELAQVGVRGGRYLEAERVADFGLANIDLEQAWTHVPRLWHVRSEVARALGQWKRSGDFLDEMEGAIRADEAPELRTGAGLIEQNRMYRARLMRARAQNLLELGVLDQCRDEIEAAEDEARLSKDPLTLLEVRLLSIDRALTSEDYDEAVSLARASQAELQAAGERAAPAAWWKPLLLAAEGMAHAELARQAVVSGASDPALTAAATGCLEAALAAETLIPGERLKTLLALADLEVTLGKATEAGEHLLLSSALVESMGPGAAPKEEVLIAVHRWRLAHSPGASRTELEQRGADLRTAFARFLGEWRRTPKRPGGIGFLYLDWRQLAVGEAVRAELELAGRERAFERVLEIQSLGTAAREAGWNTPGIGEIRSELLAPGRGLLVLVPARDGSHLFALDATKLEHFVLPGNARLRELARPVSSALLDPQRKIEEAALRSLSREILPAGARECLERWKEVVVVGFDLVRNLPFGLLLDEGGRPYGEKLAVAGVPSLPFALELARPRTTAPATLDLALIAAPEPDPALRLPSFPLGADERKRLTEPFERVRVLTGAEAVKAALLAKRETWMDARILHFFTHGLEQREEYAAALVLAPGGSEDCLLRAKDVMTLKLRGIVILSACSAGRGPLRLGDDQLVHLGGAFLDAGARCVVLARSPVNARATLALMERFHRQLAAGDAPAEALRKARAESGDLRAQAFEALGAAFDPVFP